jgi:hypothetical protein
MAELDELRAEVSSSPCPPPMPLRLEGAQRPDAGSLATAPEPTAATPGTLCCLSDARPLHTPGGGGGAGVVGGRRGRRCVPGQDGRPGGAGAPGAPGPPGAAGPAADHVRRRPPSCRHAAPRSRLLPMLTVVFSQRARLCLQVTGVAEWGCLRQVNSLGAADMSWYMLCRLDSDLHLTMDTTWTSKVRPAWDGRALHSTFLNLESKSQGTLVRTSVTLSVCDTLPDAAADRLKGAHVPAAHGSGGA